MNGNMASLEDTGQQNSAAESDASSEWAVGSSRRHVDGSIKGGSTKKSFNAARSTPHPLPCFMA